MGLPTNKKQQILEKIQTKLAAISATGGNYNYTYSGKVTLNKQSAVTEFGVDIRDGDEFKIAERESSQTLQDNELNVFISINCATASELTNIYKYESDLLKCIGLNLTWDALALHTEYISSIRDRVDQLGNKMGDMVINIKISYRKTSWNQ